jgi:hypothetical protein
MTYLVIHRRCRRCGRETQQWREARRGVLGPLSYLVNPLAAGWQCFECLAAPAHLLDHPADDEHGDRVTDADELGIGVGRGTRHGKEARSFT